MELKEYKLMYQSENAHWWFSAKRLFIKTYLSFLPKKKKLKILDIGCGTGRNLELLNKFGFTSGIDSSKLAVKFCKKRGLKNINYGLANKLSYSLSVFDLITLFDVLYHKEIKNDLQVLKEAYRVLKSKGFILVTDCAYQFLYGPHDQAMHARQRYLKKELESKLKKAGFKIIKSSHIFTFTSPFLLINRLLSKYLKLKSGSDVSPTPGLINQLLIFILKIESNLLSFINLPFGSSIIILAQK